MRLEMSSLLQDLRYAFRQFLKSPGFAIGAVVSLMLGIGATTILFSVVYGVLLDPYPYKDTNRIVYFELLNKSGRYQPIPVTLASLLPFATYQRSKMSFFNNQDCSRISPATILPSP
jgi:hypothetical protein